MFNFISRFLVFIGIFQRLCSSVEINFDDPRLKDQWYLGIKDKFSSKYPDRHNNIVSAWKQGATGKDVQIVLMDNGVQMDHPDIKDNLLVDKSYDYFAKTKYVRPLNPYMPGHGTIMAGIMGMQPNNSYCGVGIAYNSKIAAFRLVGRKMRESYEVHALNHLMNTADVYSMSYGVVRKGRYYAEVGRSIRSYLKGIKEGRNGLGSIYVRSSGNGGRTGDHCSTDRNVNLIYNIGVASASRDHTYPYYGEQCAAIMTSAYTQHTNLFFRGYYKDIVSSGLDSKCIESQGGVSVAVAVVSSVIALALSVNDNLSWRDVQHLVVQSSSRNGMTGYEWVKNGAGFDYNPKYGFGMINAGKMVKKAKKWKNVGEQGRCRRKPFGIYLRVFIVEKPKTVSFEGVIDDCKESFYMEHVILITQFRYSRRGDVSIKLTSPSGTTSEMFARRSKDSSNRMFSAPFMSVQFWGEKANGKWKIEFTFHNKGRGIVRYTTLYIYGTNKAVKII